MIFAGLKLIVIGMGVVTLFLLLLVLVVNMSFRLLAKQSAQELEEMESTAVQKKRGRARVDEGNVLAAVISAAVTAHRSRTG
jgi:sodium pump decarboxylase gamma subunit